MSSKKEKNIVASPSLPLILQWITNGEIWRLGIGEDPHWGQRPIDQLIIKAAIHELANKLTDQTVRKQIQTNIADGLERTVKGMIEEAK